MRRKRVIVEENGQKRMNGRWWTKGFLPMSGEKLEVWAINHRLPPHQKKGSNLLIKRALWKSLLSLVACRVFILSIIYINMYKLSKKKEVLSGRDIRCCEASLNTRWSSSHVSTPITPEWSFGRRIPTEIQSRTAGVLRTEGLGLHFQFYSYPFIEESSKCEFKRV